MSDSQGRDIKIDQYTLSFHGRLLIEGAEIALNYGQRSAQECAALGFILIVS